MWGFARQQKRLAGGRLRLAGRVIQGPDRAATVACHWMDAASGPARVAVGMDRLMQGRRWVACEAPGLELRPIDLGLLTRVFSSGSKHRSGGGATKKAVSNVKRLSHGVNMENQQKNKPNAHTDDANGNHLPFFLRTLRSLGFGFVSIFVFSAMLLGAESHLSKSQLSFGVGGAYMAVVARQLFSWHNKASPTKSFAAHCFFGTIGGTITATIVFGAMSPFDRLISGIGSGITNGLLVTAAAMALRTAILSFPRKTEAK